MNDAAVRVITALLLPSAVMLILELVPPFTIVPKIESRAGIKNILEIVDVLGKEKIVMLDHDDLYSEILRNHVEFEPKT